MKTTHLLAPLAVLLAAACAPTRPPAAETAPSRAESIDVPTPVVLAPAGDLQSRIEHLAKQREVTSEGVGYGGEKSDSYAAFEAVLATASAADLEPLLEHDSPVVRAYVAGHFARNDGSRLNAIRAALRDESPLPLQYGCMRMDGSVAEHVVTQLCGARSLHMAHAHEAGQLLLEHADDDTSPVQDDAKRCLRQT